MRPVTDRACETNKVDFTYYGRRNSTTADRVAMVDKAVSDGYNVIVMPGYDDRFTIVEAAEPSPTKFAKALDVAAGDILAAALGDKYDYNPANRKVTDYYHADNVYDAQCIRKSSAATWPVTRL